MVDALLGVAGEINAEEFSERIRLARADIRHGFAVTKKKKKKKGFASTGISASEQSEEDVFGILKVIAGPKVVVAAPPAPKPVGADDPDREYAAWWWPSELGSPPVLEPEPEEDLMPDPIGQSQWEVRYSRRQKATKKRAYWVNRATGEQTWRNPFRDKTGDVDVQKDRYARWMQEQEEPPAPLPMPEPEEVEAEAAVEEAEVAVREKRMRLRQFRTIGAEREALAEEEEGLKVAEADALLRRATLNRLAAQRRAAVLTEDALLAEQVSIPHLILTSSSPHPDETHNPHLILT